MCRRKPPNHCQALLYYTLFKSKIPRHRDFYDVGDLRDYLDPPHLMPTPKDGVTTMSFTDVLIFTLGVVGANRGCAGPLRLTAPQGGPERLGA